MIGNIRCQIRVSDTATAVAAFTRDQITLLSSKGRQQQTQTSAAEQQKGEETAQASIRRRYGAKCRRFLKD